MAGGMTARALENQRREEHKEAIAYRKMLHIEMVMPSGSKNQGIGTGKNCCIKKRYCATV